jgi:ABC-2 type transport system ATP-binding protein
MLEVRGLTKYYGSFPGVVDVGFSIRPGQILGYLGPNGSGKSTTVKMVTGLLEPTRGAVLYGGGDIRADLIGFKKILGYVPEEPHLYSYLTGPEYLQLVGRLRGLDEAVLDAKIEGFMRLFSLEADQYSTLAAYSKGMRQKILLAAALLHDPELIVLDEPFSGLDVTSTLVLRSLLRMLAAEGKVVLFSSHVLEIVEKICSDVVILADGRVVANDSVERLRDLMSLPSLEDVFARLVVQEDIGTSAQQLRAVMRLA